MKTYLTPEEVEKLSPVKREVYEKRMRKFRVELPEYKPSEYMPLYFGSSALYVSRARVNATTALCNALLSDREELINSIQEVINMEES